MAERPVRIPKVSLAVHEAALREWRVEDGRRVQQGETLFVVETEKVETEIAAAVSGVVHWTATLGETYKVGTQIGSIETDDAEE
jgi:pyruvate/2-oxoglutarate dehydrogenase complex dihydrolipoamide acyltransferase (E2) component